MTSRVGIFIRSARPLRHSIPCAICRQRINVPRFFWTPPVSQGGPIRHRCERCVHIAELTPRSLQR